MIERYQTPEMKAIFNDSKRFDYMLRVEQVVAEVQARHKVIPHKAYLDIRDKSRIHVKKIHKIEQTTKHDVIAFVSQVAESVGENGKYLHFGLTSSDVLDTALSLQLRDGMTVILKSVDQLQSTLKSLARKHKKTICAGRTHGIFAELTTFGFKLLGFASELSRCQHRIQSALDQIQICKLSGAVGTSSALDMKIEAEVAKKLKLKVEPVATQVIPRDRHAEVLYSLSFLAAYLERLAIELRHLQRTEVGEVIEGFKAGQKGSSAMPHKKNPISAENITGLARLVKGYAQVAMDNIPLWHERDISHSSNERVILQDAFTASHYMLNRMNHLLHELYVDVHRMKKNTLLKGGVLYSSHVLNHLVQKHKMNRDKAYQLVQRLAFELNDDQLLSRKIMVDAEASPYFTLKDINSIFSGEKYITAISKRFDRYEKEIN